jgi:hypothetical protein
MKITKGMTGLLAVGFLASVAIGYGGALAVAEDGGDYPKTADGRTYGTLPTNDEPLAVSDVPDLVAVVGENGVDGYITKDAFIGGEAPQSPEEALKWQASASSTTVPVYAEDGTTVVDSFTIDGPNDGPVVEVPLKDR